MNDRSATQDEFPCRSNRTNMKFDILTRTYHLLLAMSLIAIFIFSKVLGESSSYFAYHMIVGISLLPLMLLRLGMLMFGPSSASWKSNKPSVSNLKSYFWEVIRNSVKDYSGHNPATQWFLFLLIPTLFILVGTGLLSATDLATRFSERIHEYASNFAFLLVLGHLLGLTLSFFQKGIGVISRMGFGSLTKGDFQFQALHFWAFAGLLLQLGLVLTLVLSFDPKSSILKLGEISLQLGDPIVEEGETE